MPAQLTGVLATDITMFSPRFQRGQLESAIFDAVLRLEEGGQVLLQNCVLRWTGRRWAVRLPAQIWLPDAYYVSLCSAALRMVDQAEGGRRV